MDFAALLLLSVPILQLVVNAENILTALRVSSPVQVLDLAQP